MKAIVIYPFRDASIDADYKIGDTFEIEKGKAEKLCSLKLIKVEAEEKPKKATKRKKVD